MSHSHLTPEQAELSKRIYQTLRQGVESDLRSLAELLASKPDRQLLGKPSSRSATACTRSAPRPSKPLWTSGKKLGWQTSPLNVLSCTYFPRF